MLLKALLSGSLLASFAMVPALAALKTTPTAIACLAPSDLPAAEEASRNQNRTRMDMLGCFPIQPGAAAKRIGEKAGLWHVVLDPNGSDPMEAWARPSSFRE